MARFLFVVPPLTGHTNPTVSVARALEARGHEVAWVAHPRAVRPLLPEGARLFELDDHVPTERWEAKSAESRAVRGLAALKFLWEEFFVPLARAMRPGVADAVDRFQPAVLVVDQLALAGALVARQRSLPWATVSTTSAGLVDPLAGLPMVRKWLDDQLAGLEREAGLAPAAEPDALRTSSWPSPPRSWLAPARPSRRTTASWGRPSPRARRPTTSRGRRSIRSASTSWCRWAR
ncbi:MAG: hypothetical protein WKG00_19145 [Polyangiaceae bacterium]